MWAKNISLASVRTSTDQHGEQVSKVLQFSHPVSTHSESYADTLQPPQIFKKCHLVTHSKKQLHIFFLEKTGGSSVVSKIFRDFKEVGGTSSLWVMV